MKIDLAYGKTGLSIDLPESCQAQVLRPRWQPGLADEAAGLRAALQQPVESPPLRELARPGSRVGVVVNDITRATPTPLLLEAILAELAESGLGELVIFVATGTHRPNTPAELEGMLGMPVKAGEAGALFAQAGREIKTPRPLRALRDEIYEPAGIPIIQNEATNQATQACLGQTSLGTPVWLNRRLLECDLKILTGFIEPHLFAGFSGGSKALMPGIAGLATILGNHSPRQVAHPLATWGVTHGNPLWEEIQEIAGRVENTFLLNVSLNRQKDITGVFAGALEAAHALGCQQVRQAAMQPVKRPFDVVLTTNSGYPLDLNLYQSVKGLSAAAQVVRPGGAILLAAECREGLPEHSEYERLLRQAASPAELLEWLQQAGPLPDGWQVQIQAQVQQKADVYVYSEGLTEAHIRQAHLAPVRSIEAALPELAQKYGPRLGVLPEGPLTIPYVI